MIALSLASTLVACKGTSTPEPSDVPTVPEGSGLLGDHPLNPFPVGALHDAAALDTADFDLPDSATPFPFERLAFRTGFSPGQTSVVVLDSVDASALPHWSDPTPGAGSVQLYDLDDGTFLPVFAELDAHPSATPNTLLIRPLQALPHGHEIAVVLTTAVTPRPERFEALIHGTPAPELAAHADGFRALVTQLEDAGVDDLALAWSFPIGDGTAPTRSVWEQAEATAWNFTDVRDEHHATAPFTYRAARGSYTTTDFLVDDTTLSIDGQTGLVSPNGTTEAYLYVHVPLSVADAPAHSVPILVFGHGIFATPDLYLDTADDGDSLNRLCEEGGYIAVGTTWRGLTTPDVGGAISVATDFGRMHELTDRLVQGQGNITSLIDLIDAGAILDDPIFQGRSGQALASDKILYYGISLGGIEGTVLQASDPPLDGSVLHVPGSTWSTMLERSSNWTQFELLLDISVPDPLVRQRLYASSQLWWDSVDPIAFTPDLQDKDFLYQVAIGDEQVPNMTSYTLARSIGLPQITPLVDPVFGLTATQSPAQRGLVQLDSETVLPPDVNRPAPETGAHTAPRSFDGTLAQIQRYLEDETIIDACGPTHPCTASSPAP